VTRASLELTVKGGLFLQFSCQQPITMLMHSWQVVISGFSLFTKQTVELLRSGLFGAAVLFTVANAGAAEAPTRRNSGSAGTSVDFPAPDYAIGALEKFSGPLLVGTVVGGILLFVGWTLYRRRHESEIRALTGNYLSDGIEAAWLKFPEVLKAGADVRSASALSTLASFAEPENEEFFRWAPRNIKAMQKSVADLGALMEASARQPILAELSATIESFKSRTSKANLRPAWQLAFVIELLVNRLRERPSEVTLSTMRTIASALDVLASSCRSGVRPDLLTEPPLAVLAVDDDPLCLRAVAFALQKAGLSPETAVDGGSAVSKCRETSYDVVFMDIMMPGIDGLEACRQIRNLPNNTSTPVVFVTARSDFQTRERSTEVGGAELIAKPFLVTELTVKAISFCMRKRMNLPLTSSSGLEDSVTLATTTPANGAALESVQAGAAPKNIAAGEAKLPA
jgi:CheY-like chemotaxis protein